ncbi:hypothetical protein TRFO_06855 [Tritrichomonas foetus]|uniref:Outer dense fiber protein 3 n=1 Tax=Tritrichomonas foetus TaxID=1144522 RepID=A0A1J4K067_9EUKA|nr:hypothetical protein TRFO_06855 [Tritrichomonas foetus]|eukprot:OHT03172.1 hypothetical protein TRFO_06855 [Tritrichomonas foetus]
MTSSTTLVRVSKNRAKMPGPGEYVIHPTFGTEGIRPSFGGRPHEKEKEKGIGYENIGSTIGAGPKWSFHARPKERNIQSSPGPDYLPPSFGKNAPSSSFHGYVKQIRSSDKSPGPGQYQVNSPITKGKGFTLKARVFPPDEGKNDSPGPKYSYDYKTTLPNAKGFQYHPMIETKQKIDSTPGPGHYVVDRKLASSAMSFHGYHKEVKKDVFPGPGQYPVKHDLGADAPKFSIRPRIEKENKVSGARYEVIPSTVGDGPKWSLGKRVDVKQKETSPGPNYVPPPLGKDSRHSSLYSRHDETKRTTPLQTPGPGKYQIKSSIGDGKKFTLKARQFPPDEGKTVSPGPAAYKVNFNDAPPPRTIHPLVKDPTDKEAKPKYNYIDNSFGKDAPKFTIGRKEDLDLEPGLP